jgi:hypothetical protein
MELKGNVSFPTNTKVREWMDLYLHILDGKHFGKGVSSAYL